MGRMAGTFDRTVRRRAALRSLVVLPLIIMLIASLLAVTGLFAVVAGIRGEYKSRKAAPTIDEIQLLVEIEEWLKQQQ